LLERLELLGLLLVLRVLALLLLGLELRLLVQEPHTASIPYQEPYPN
jgi:hypothetical protein